MNKKRRKNKKQTPVKKDPRDKKAERIIYSVLIILALILVMIGYRMSQEVATEVEVQEENHFHEIKK